MNDKRRTLNFTGTLTAVTPITVSVPGDEDRKKGKSMLPRLGANLERAQAYIEGRTLRGVMRHRCLDILERAVRRQTGKEKVFTVQDIYMLSQGVDCSKLVNSDNQKIYIDGEAKLRSDNPALSVFGRWGLGGRLNVAPMIPTVSNEHCVYIAGNGMRTNVFLRDPSRIEFLDAENLETLKTYLQEDAEVAKANSPIDQAINNLKKKLRKEKCKEARAELQAEHNRLVQEKKDNKDSKSGSAETIQRPLPGFEAFLPGTVFNHKLAIENADQYEIGLVLAVLRELAKSPRIGGHSAEHFGEFMAEWTVSSWDGDEDAPTTHGKVRLGLHQFEILEEPGSTILSDALNAWTQALKQEKPLFNFKRYLFDEAKELDITDGSTKGRIKRDEAA